MFAIGKNGSKTAQNTARVVEDGINPIRASMMPIDATPHEKGSGESAVAWTAQKGPSSVAVV